MEPSERAVFHIHSRHLVRRVTVLCYNLHMNTYPSKKQKAAVIVGIILIIAALVVTAAWAVLRDNNDSDKPKAVSQSESVRPGDTARKEHASALANRLFTYALVLKRSVPDAQAGLDEIATDRDGNIVTDPTTVKPYVFVDDQSAMKVGEAYFRIGASCDNKVTGSDGEGRIVDSIDNSVAVTIKLESGGFACESSL